MSAGGGAERDAPGGAAAPDATDAAAAATLEQRLARLEAIVARLEREDLELEDALGLFEEGVAHLRAAREAVEGAELRVLRLLEEGARDAGGEEEAS